MRKTNYALVVILALLGGVCGAYAWSALHTEAAKPRETAYERVMRTGVLHCAYGIWEPAVMRDPTTGAFSGIVYDLMQEIGKSLNLKVEYDLEVSWDSIGVALASGKADAHCAGVFATP